MAVYNQVVGPAQCSTFTDGWCRVAFSVFQPWGNYFVVDTDYTDYAIVYSCTGILAQTYCIELVWILTRTPYKQDTPEAKALQTKAYGIIKEKLPNFDLSVMMFTD